VHWKSTAIIYRDGVVRLSNGKDRKPIEIKAPQKPVCVEMYHQRGSYYFSLVYKVEPPPREITGNVVAVDMGEIHPILLTLT
jgi:transposase